MLPLSVRESEVSITSYTTFDFPIPKGVQAYSTLTAPPVCDGGDPRIPFWVTVNQGASSSCVHLSQDTLHWGLIIYSTWGLCCKRPQPDPQGWDIRPNCPLARVQLGSACPSPASTAGIQAKNGPLSLASMSWTSVAGAAALALIGATVRTRSYWAAH